MFQERMYKFPAYSFLFLFCISFTFAQTNDFAHNRLPIPEEEINYSLIPTVNNSDLLDGLEASAFLRVDGSLPLTANWDVGGFNITNVQNIAGTSPLHLSEGFHAMASSEVEGNLTADKYIGNFSTTPNNYDWSVHDDGSNIHIAFNTLGGSNYVGLETAGAFFQLYANPNPSNNYLMATITETQGTDTNINFYEGGTGHNRFWDSGSARFGGNSGYLCSELTTDVDCDTSGTGADVVVQDDIWAGGKLFASDWSNITITESQISDLTHPTTDLSGYWTNNGSSTATGNWNLSDKNLTTTGEGRFGHVHVGVDSTSDPIIMFDGATNDGSLTYDESSNQFLFDGGLFVQPTTPTTNSQAILISNNPKPTTASQQFRNLAFSSTFILESGSDQSRFTGIQSDASAIYGGFGGFGSADDLILKGVTTKVTKTAGTAGNFPNSKHYGYYIEQVSGGTAENWGLYNADDVDMFMGLDNSKTIIGTGLDVETYWDANDYVINTTTGNTLFKNNTGWGEIEYGNAIDHTYLTDATDKEAYELVKSQQAHEYNLDGTYNYSSWGECYVQGETTDYSRPEIEYYEIEEEVWDNSTGEWLNTNTTEMVTYEREIYPYTIQTEGTNVGCKQVMIQKADNYERKTMKVVETTQYGTVADFDFGIMTENIWTQSKVVEDNVSYIDKIKDKEKLKVKQDHYAYELIDGYELLNMEERVVSLEGAVNEIFTILCDKNILKKEDGCL